jgi:hypothetical protein
MSIPSASTAPNDHVRARRFAGLARAPAVAILLALAVSIALGFGYASHPQRVIPPAHSVNGFRLYTTIIARMRAGQPYANAAVEELRAEGGPLKPFVTVRPPALATALSWLPNSGSRAVALMALSTATLILWTIRLRPYGSGPAWLGWTVVALFSGIGPPLVAAGPMSLFHEAWAGLLIALSLGLRTERRYVAAAVVGCLAALVRELALPYLVVMAIVAFAERRHREGAAFCLALAVALAALAWHASAVAALTTPQDLASPGWVAVAGWRFVLSAAQWNCAAAVLGMWGAAVIVPVALVGGPGSRDDLGRRLTALMFGYCLGFMVIGRLSNAYWGLVTTPLFAIGVTLAPSAIADLARSAARRAIRGTG